jgi:hypothetical protein
MHKTIAILLSTIVLGVSQALGFQILQASTLIQQDKMENNIDRENWMLPEDFRVYVGEGGVINHPVPSYQEHILPTVNRYRGKDGGYIAIYSHNASQGVYSVGEGIYVIGQIRLQGKYIGRIFHPTGYEGQDISAVEEFKRLADETFSACQGDCWAGGDTGGWFGIPLE